MTSLVGLILSALLLYKYAALFVVAFIAALIFPLPASTTLAAASAFASQGYMNIALVFIVALAANVAGDNAGYYLARRYGRETLQKIGFGKILRSDNYKKVEAYILEYPVSVIFFSRFSTEIGPALNIVAGLIRVPYRVYLVTEFVGELLYVTLFTAIGYFLGSQWENNTLFLTKAGLVMVSVGALIIFIQIVLFRRHHQPH